MDLKAFNEFSNYIDVTSAPLKIRTILKGNPKVKSTKWRDAASLGLPVSTACLAKADGLKYKAKLKLPASQSSRALFPKTVQAMVGKLLGGEKIRGRFTNTAFGVLGENASPKRLLHGELQPIPSLSLLGRPTRRFSRGPFLAITCNFKLYAKDTYSEGEAIEVLL